MGITFQMLGLPKMGNSSVPWKFLAPQSVNTKVISGRKKKIFQSLSPKFTYRRCMHLTFVGYTSVRAGIVPRNLMDKWSIEHDLKSLCELHVFVICEPTAIHLESQHPSSLKAESSATEITH